jgi:cell division protease FtsH
MDGFERDDNIIIFAATNLASTLDPALLRSGRFDKKVYFDLPNINERKLMFERMLQDTKVQALDFDSLAERSAGLSGADIANVVNQAKINAIQYEYKNISDDCVQEALDEVMIGKEKRERLVSPKERTRICFHEAGHALMGFVLKDTNAPVKVSVVPRGANALGFSQPKPELKYIHTRNEILSRIAVLLAGRCAEIIVYEEVSSGASDDIEKISDLSRKYFTHWGMDNEGVFLPHHLSDDSEDLQNKCQELTYRIEGGVINILTQHRKYLDKIASKLSSQETLSYIDLKKILKSKRESKLTISEFL